MINRSAIAVRPKQPFLDWLKSVEKSNESLSLAGLDRTIYLVPEYDEPDDAEKILLVAYEGIFNQELFSWYTKSALWPQDRSLEVFKEWFDYEHFELVEDLVAGPVGDDDYFSDYGDEDDEDEYDDDSYDDEEDDEDDSGEKAL
jgi:hypothetical protein